MGCGQEQGDAPAVAVPHDYRGRTTPHLEGGSEERHLFGHRPSTATGAPIAMPIDREHQRIAEQPLGDGVEVLMRARLPVKQHDRGSMATLDDEEGLR